MKGPDEVKMANPRKHKSTSLRKSKKVKEPEIIVQEIKVDEPEYVKIDETKLEVGGNEAKEI